MATTRRRRLAGPASELPPPFPDPHQAVRDGNAAAVRRCLDAGDDVHGDAGVAFSEMLQVEEARGPRGHELLPSK